ncbi:MAG: pyruvate kinase [Lachnospiraceae bacterium]|nr:pyruvate kinase [Lachnospiraceae bacterium]
MLKKKTKIVCTMGPSSDDIETLRTLMTSGMDVARLNFSHGSHEEQLGRMNNIKALREELGLHTAILLDTKGPEIRTGVFKDGKVEVKEGQIFTLTTEDIEGTEERVSITYDELPQDVSVGNSILIDDGLIELKVQSKTDTEIVCKVVNGGVIGSRKGINVPNVRVNLPGITPKDREDIIFGLENGIDFIAASFIRNADAVREIRILCEMFGNGRRIGIISKIENMEGVENLDEIIAVSDGIMVARGDLGVEIPAEDVPFLQKRIIEKCNDAFKPVITATQMLDSMMRNPRPTRAEVTDVANAINEGTDAIMLSGETAAGKYPVEALRTMSRIAESTEIHLQDSNKEFRMRYVDKSTSAAVAYSAVQLACNINAKYIVASSVSGFTARIVSNFRPNAMIAGLSPSEDVLRRMQLYWGVQPMLSKSATTTDEIFDSAVKIIANAGLVHHGDRVVLTGGGPADKRGKGTTSLLKVAEI